MSAFIFVFEPENGNPDKIEARAADAKEARTSALRTFGQMIQDEPDRLLADGNWTLTVTTHDGLSLCQITAIVTNAPALKWS